MGRNFLKITFGAVIVFIIFGIGYLIGNSSSPKQPISANQSATQTAVNDQSQTAAQSSTNDQFQTDTQTNTQASANGSGSQTNNRVMPSPVPPLTAEDVTKKFYTWYISNPGISALTSGLYNTNPYLTNNFKETIKSFAPYDADKDPVFCTKNKVTDITVQPAEPAPDGRTNVIITENKPGGRNLFMVTLVQTNGNWFIDDTACMR